MDAPAGGRKKRLARKWTPELFALYLLGKHPVWAIPSVSAEEIRHEFPELGMSKDKIDRLRSDPQFEETVKREFTDRIKDKNNLERMFLTYLQRLFDTNMKAENPSAKLADILGFMTGLYNPKKQEPVKPQMSAAQIARMKHAQEQAEARRKEREGGGDGNQ